MKPIYNRVFSFFLIVFIHQSKAQQPGNTLQSSGDSIRLHNLDDDVDSSTSEVFPRRENSYWIPYSDRTAAVMTFPVIPEEIFQQEAAVSEPQLPWNKWMPVASGGHGNSGRYTRSSQYGTPAPYGPKYKNKLIAKPKSDLGVVVSRNYILKENFRDYADLCKFPQNQKPSDDLILDMSKQFMKTPRHSPSENYVIVGFESRLRTMNTSNAFETRQFHNGTVTVRSSTNPRQMISIPFTLTNLRNPDSMISKLQNVTQLTWREKEEVKSFLKVIHGIHAESFDEGNEALERFHQRSRKLGRPRFVIDVENSTEARNDDPQREAEARRELRRVAELEDKNRSETWFHTSTVAMRVISSPSFYIKKVPLPPVPTHPPQVIKYGGYSPHTTTLFY